jgi:hypothetical protein
MTGMARKEGSRFLSDRNSLEWRKSVLYRLLQWLGLSEVVYSLNGMALTCRTGLWPAWNGLQWRKLIFARPDWFPQHFFRVG